MEVESLREEAPRRTLGFLCLLRCRYLAFYWAVSLCWANVQAGRGTVVPAQAVTDIAGEY